MSAPPEAKTEYSRGSGASGRVSRRRRGPRPPLPARRVAGHRRGPARGILGALLARRSSSPPSSRPLAPARLRSRPSARRHPRLRAGADRAGLAVALAAAVTAAGPAALVASGRARPGRSADRALGDLPDAHATGLIGSSGVDPLLTRGTPRPAPGFYLETLGAVLLLVSGGWVLLLRPAPSRGHRRRRTRATGSPDHEPPPQSQQLPAGLRVLLASVSADGGMVGSLTPDGSSCDPA